MFTQLEKSHNDLHADNVIVRTLDLPNFRSDAIDPTIRAVAIDFGSVLDMSRSGETETRIGDQANIAIHLAALASAVHRPGIEGSDIDYRIAEALRGFAEHLTPAPDATRVMAVEDVSNILRAALLAADEPWRQKLSLRRFGDAYNAQALESWHVPDLWFDPENKWLEKTTGRGPQVITGMRGCGKTMLLRALHFHARVARAEDMEPSQRLSLLAKDGFLGVYASCQKLLNPQDRGGTGEPGTVEQPFERLFIAYLRDAVQVLRHLRLINPTALVGSIDIVLRDALRVVDLPSGIPTGTTEQAFDHFLMDLQFALAEGTAECRLRAAPAEAFGHLAGILRGAAPALAGKYVLFLLDDVSTRYLHREMVREVISRLLFQHPNCAFRITTEAQALHRVLLSPGGNAPADPLRDYEEFNLGNEVYRLLREGSLQDRMDFVSEILRRRGKQFPDPIYRREPVEVLGDVTLVQLAREIAASSATSADRKKVYRGLRALQAVCVGDLGDVVKLYDRILQRANANTLPVPAEKQTDSFLEHSAGLIHFLNRRDQHKKNLAQAFAEAAGELLQRSNRTRSATGPEPRQYTKLYVRVDAGVDSEAVANRLLDLLDAGVFVYDGGVPRTKTRDNDPVLQFKLSYRKMLGLHSFIGLADRDRFELSGETLREWLERPEAAKQILLESEARQTEDSHEPAGASERVLASNAAVDVDVGAVGDEPRALEPAQLDLLSTASVEELEGPAGAAESKVQFAPSLGLAVTTGSLDDWAARDTDAVVIALGFEERTLTSAERLLSKVRPKLVLFVRYSGDEQGVSIKRLVEAQGLPFEEVDNPERLSECLAGVGPNVIIDSTGISKPFLFIAVRDVLLARHQVSVVHTLAEHYYPRNEDLIARGITADAPVSAETFRSLEDVLTGEAAPYRLELIHYSPAAPERSRALIASASPKNDRLLHLLDERAYDATRILVPPPSSPRRRVAKTAAELAASAADANIGLVEVETNDIEAAVRETESTYAELYFGSGANVEVGLTGSKMHAVAFAALAAAARVAYAWYVAPASFDRKRFTEGVGETHCFDLRIPD
ncbi:MAG TPA: hypothetical protein VJU82_09605 [Acidobacteriaceae bacterium]|nr:hypothetical protein [Acidobacteriaceae bacterium]